LGDPHAEHAEFKAQKSLPWAAVWDCYCMQKGAPVGRTRFDEIRQCGAKVLAKRANT
jgi:L-rhamnose isomerase